MASSIKITELSNIGSNIAPSTVLPVVSVVGTAVTQKANLQIVGNLILNGAGGSNFVPAARALQAATVTNAAQPNITSVGTLTSLDVSGTSNLGNLVVGNYFQGTFLGTIDSAAYANVANSVAVANVVGIGNIATIDLTGSNANVLYGNGTWAPVSGGIGGATDRLVNGVNELVLEADGNVTLPSGSPLLFGNGNSRIQAGMGFHINSEEGISLEAVDVTDPLDPITVGWYFGTDGNLTLPSNSPILFGTGNAFIQAGATLRLSSEEGVSLNAVDATDPDNLITSRTSFNTNGSISYPGDVKQNHQDNTLCAPGVSTVIYTTTERYKYAVKLFVMVEDSGNGARETQACDIVAVRGQVNNVVHVTAYGVTYSSALPIATFDGRWNDITNRMEITCLPSGTYDVKACVYALEMTTNYLPQ